MGTRKVGFKMVPFESVLSYVRYQKDLKVHISTQHVHETMRKGDDRAKFVCIRIT